MIKRILCALLALVLLLALSACAKSGDSSSAAPSGSAENSAGSQESASGTAAPESASSGVDAEKAKLSGKLNYLTLGDRDPSVLRGLSLAGNRAGSEEFNAKPAAADGIRCIFELNEYVACTLDTELQSGIDLFVFYHRDDPEFYETAAFSDETPGFLAAAYLERGEEGWNPEFYLNPDDVEPGLCDFVFVYQDKAIATLLTRFYREGELEGKSDAELAALMKE